MTENSNAKVSVHLEGPYWLTRDKRGGKLSEKIDVWLVKPDLLCFEDGDVMWLPSLGLSEESEVYAQWSISQCLKECYVYPETERECIKKE